MVFFIFFFDGIGDLINIVIKWYVILGEKVKYLIKFVEIINGKWVYRFVSYLRFVYWVFNMI